MASFRLWYGNVCVSDLTRSVAFFMKPSRQPWCSCARDDSLVSA
jgi:hypothetical protein